MDFETVPTDVLDLLFDGSCGTMKDSVPGNITTNIIPHINNISRHDFAETNYSEQDGVFHGISFGDLDLLSDNLFESLINAAQPDSLLDGESPSKRRTVHSDHDYIAHKSPSEHSDSETSVISDDSNSVLRRSLNSQQNMTDDQLELFSSPMYSSTYPDNIKGSNFPAYTDSAPYNMFKTDAVYVSMVKAEQTGYGHIADKIAADNDDLDYTSGGNDDDTSIDFDMDNVDSSSPSSDLRSCGTQSVLVLNGSSKKLIPIQRINKMDRILPFTMADVDPHIGSCANYPELRLTDEEKELLAKEGVSLPSNLPLTRDEERLLKAVRRKIRNKISAKESRKRKQGYVDGLEQRVKLCTQENRELQKKVHSLEKQNVSLITQLKRLQCIVGKSKVPAQASTCAMVLLLSFALLVVPTLSPFGSSNENNDPDFSRNVAIRGKARSLLEHKDIGVADYDEDPYGVSTRQSVPWEKQVFPQIVVFKSDKGSPVFNDDSNILRPGSILSEEISINTRSLVNTISHVLSRDDVTVEVKGQQVLSVYNQYKDKIVNDHNFTERNTDVNSEL